MSANERTTLKILKKAIFKKNDRLVLKTNRVNDVENVIKGTKKLKLQYKMESITR